MINEIGAQFVKNRETYFNENFNRCFFVVYSTGDLLAFSAGTNFFTAVDLADLIAF